ncbi:hypothetical protein TSMEX_004175 [Taenia solium]|eukprot:TsM_000177600 transcript=TsM_000177600 gene=TsM_000177600
MKVVVQRKYGVYLLKFCHNSKELPLKTAFKVWRLIESQQTRQTSGISRFSEAKSILLCSAELVRLNQLFLSLLFQASLQVLMAGELGFQNYAPLRSNMEVSEPYWISKCQWRQWFEGNHPANDKPQAPQSSPLVLLQWPLFTIAYTQFCGWPL